MYGLAGERRLPEWEIDWLPGYEGSRPVRAGNAAATQMQLDVYGELMDALHQARHAGLVESEGGWHLQKALIAHLETIWEQPDEGIWEVRGERQHFTHAKVRAWLALERVVRTATEFGLSGPLRHWQELRDVSTSRSRAGFDAELGCSCNPMLEALDASLPATGCSAPAASRPRIENSVAATTRAVLVDSLCARHPEYTWACRPAKVSFSPVSLASCNLAYGRRERRASFRARSPCSRRRPPRREVSTPIAKRRSHFPQAFPHLSAGCHRAQSCARRAPRAQGRCVSPRRRCKLRHRIAIPFKMLPLALAS